MANQTLLEQSPSQTEALPGVNQTLQQRPKRRKKMSQEKGMLLLTVFFIGGVILLTLVPEDTPMRGAAMGLFVGLLFLAFFKWLL